MKTISAGTDTRIRTFSADSIKYDFWKTVATLLNDQDFVIRMAARYLVDSGF